MSWFPRSLHHCALLAFALGTLISPVPARADMPILLNFYGENNDTIASLSSGAAGMPSVTMTLTATLWLGTDPWPNQTVTFTVDDPNLLALSVASATTNDNGQCRVDVTGRGVVGGAIVTARWTNGVKTRTDQVLVDLVTEVQNPGNTGALLAPYPSRQAIRFNDTASAMAGFSSEARATWSVSGRIFFSQEPEYWLAWREVIDSMNPMRFGVTTSLNNPYGRQIQYNVFALDGQPWLRGTSFCPIGWRKQGSKRWLAPHELGHALVLGHNVSRKTLMFDLIDAYFLWQIEAPTSFDWPTVLATYP